MIMKTLFLVDKSFQGLKMANYLALEALKKSAYLHLSRLDKFVSWGCESYIKPRHKYYWIYEFDDTRPCPFPSFNIHKDGNYCDGTKSNFGKLVKK